MGLQGRHHLRQQAGGHLQLERVRRRGYGQLQRECRQRGRLHRLLQLPGVSLLLQGGAHLQGVRGQAVQLPGDGQRQHGGREGVGREPCHRRGDAVLPEPDGHHGVERGNPPERGGGLRHAALPKRRFGQRRDEILRLHGRRGGGISPVRVRHPHQPVAPGGRHQGGGLGLERGPLLPDRGGGAVGGRKRQERAGGRGAGRTGGLEGRVGGLLRVHHLFVLLHGDAGEEGHREAAAAAGAGRGGKRADRHAV